MWTEGTIKLIVESKNRDPIVLVHYNHLDDSKDEVVFKNSPRLAKHTTYTSR